jgi:hypothetical protein
MPCRACLYHLCEPTLDSISFICASNRAIFRVAKGCTQPTIDVPCQLWQGVYHRLWPRLQSVTDAMCRAVRWCAATSRSVCWHCLLFWWWMFRLGSGLYVLACFVLPTALVLLCRFESLWCSYAIPVLTEMQPGSFLEYAKLAIQKAREVNSEH